MWLFLVYKKEREHRLIVNPTKTQAKDVLLTGASGVIGSAMARRLAEEGCRLHLASRDSAKLDPLKKELERAGTPAHAYALHLEDIDQCAGVVDDFFKKAKHPYGLICNAGNLGVVGSFLEVRFEAWSNSLRENFLSHAAMIQRFGRHFKEKGRKTGSVVVLSGAGLGGPMTFANLSSYSTAKAALVHLVEALSLEFTELDIMINAIAPGQVVSGITEQALQAGPERAGAFAENARNCKRTGGVSPDLAARLTAFLMSDQSRGITGRLLSARFDQEVLRKESDRIASDLHRFRLRRIDNTLFAPKTDGR